MFKRPTSRNALTRIRHIIYPPGGWIRAIRYNRIKLLRIVDDPRRVAVGVFIGTFVAFTPFFGLHFLLAPAIAWAIGGNMLASLMATMLCNPLTFPIIAYATISLGRWILHRGNTIDDIDSAEDAGETIWNSFLSLFGGGDSAWQDFASLFEQLFLPYLVGGMLLGLASAVAAAWFTARAIASFQRLRRRIKDKK